jgi:MoxR-like ATPase
MTPPESFTRYYHGEHPLHPASDPYLASESLASAVNAAVAIGRPLLLSGEPGTGKTSLAYSMALQLGLGEVLRFDTHADSRWQDCLYQFDALRRLYDAQAKDARAAHRVAYRTFNALGVALTSTTRRLVLIDEIDKAPRDFPNGLLSAIEGALEFAIVETDERIRFQGSEDQRPVIVLTTNEERSLPDAFLRRCVFAHIKTPEPKELNRIVRARLIRDKQREGFEALASKAVDRFVSLRRDFSERLEKKPATAELLDWISVLSRAGRVAEQLDDTKTLPYAEALLKTKRDLELVLGVS